MTINVLHSCPIWLPQTQTWIYNQVKQQQQLCGNIHVVCDHTNNLSQFSVANIHSLENETSQLQIIERVLRKVGYFHQYKYLSKISKLTKTDIIHSHFGTTAWSNLRVAHKLRAKHVVTFYGFDLNKLLHHAPIWKKRYKQLFNEVDLVLCEGTHMAACLLALDCPEDKVRVQHIGVNVDEIYFQPRVWRRGEPLRVLMAAAFREKKGIPYGIEALAQIARDVPIKLTIIGDAGQDSEQRLEKEQILSKLKQCGMNESARLPGYQSHQALMNESYNHHVFLQPSITARDGDTEGGAPVSIIEMVASGMPVIATEHCDIPEVIGPAHVSPLAPERNVPKLAEGIQALLDASEEWSDLLAKGREHVENNYHLNKQTERLMSHYNSLL